MAESKARDWVLGWVEDLALTGRKYAFLGRRARAGRFGNAQFNSVLQSLGGTAYITTVAVA